MSEAKFCFKKLIAISALLTSSIPSGMAYAAVDSGRETVRSIGLETSSYLFAPASDKNSHGYQALNAHLSGGMESEMLQAFGSATLLLQLRPGQTQAFFEAPEAYLGTSPKNSAIIGFGRRLEAWNELDDRWGLGIWQPRFRWDFVHPESVGLTGGFLQGEFEHFRMVGFASPFFIPERGVQIAVEEGAMVSSSPWFLAPPSQIPVNDVPTPVKYSIELPPIREIILRKTLSLGLLTQGGAIRAGQTGLWYAAAYAYKPMNQLLLSYNGYFEHEAVGQQNAKAFVYPRILYHHVKSLELGYQFASARASLSVLADNPVRDSVPSQWTSQDVAPAVAWSPALDFQAPYLPEGRFTLSYLQVSGGNAPDQGKGTSGRGSAFDVRYPFERAFSLGFATGFRLPRGFGDAGRFSMKFIRDLAHPGSILSTEVNLMPSAKFAVRLGADILGSELVPDPRDAGSNFIGRYAANDRFYAGVSYAF